MFINGKDALNYGAKLLSDYKYTPPTVTPDHFKGRRRSNFTLLNVDVDMGKLELPMTFHARGRRDANQNKSAFDSLCLGKTDIAMEDGFQYFSVLTDIGDTTYHSSQLLECTYSFDCIRHGPYVEKHGNTIICESTLPYTDCVLTARVGQDGTNYQMGPVMFDTVYAGQVLTVDGITKRILVGGIPDASGAEWIRFPTLEPGENTFSCLDELTVGYYPSYF